MCANNQAEIFLETMFGEIGCCIPNQRYMYNIRVESEMAEISGRTNFACPNLKFTYVIVLNERSVCAKNQAEIFLETMYGEIECCIPNQRYMYNIRLESKMAKI